MKIGGFVPLTLSDYPGCCAAMVFTQGCNWRCPFCHNGSLWDGAIGFFDEEQVMNQLAQRAHLLDGVVVSGGEPTLQPDLPRFLQALRALGLKIKLDTNGSAPDVLNRLLQHGLVDFVAMDIKAPWDRYAELTGVDVDVVVIQRSVQSILDWGGAHQFRTTQVAGLLTEEDIQNIRAALPPEAIHVTQAFEAALALDPALRRAG